MNKRAKLINDSLYNLKDLKDIFNHNINKCQYINEKINETTNFIMNELSLINININIIGTFDDNNSFVQHTSDDLTNCVFYYEDIANNIIDTYKSLSYVELCSFNEFSIAPYLAEKIGVYLNNERIGEIELGNLKHSFGTRIYRVGLMSDIHYNDTTIDMDNDTYTEDGTEYRGDLLNALSFYQNKEDVEFMGVSGDVSTDSIRHILNLKQTLNNYAPTTNLYSCLGNHDFKSLSYHAYSNIGSSYNDIGLDVKNKTRLEAWNSLITPNNSKYEIHYQNEYSEYEKTSYWFEVPLEGTNKSDIYIFLSVNYGNGNNSSIANEKLIIYSDNIDPLIDYVGYMPSSYNFQFYDNATLIWFKNVLDQFTDKRIFVFTHQFFSHKAGNNNTENGLYSYAADDWRITPNNAYCLSGIQFEFLNKLNNEYKNVIWFSGHSHYKWIWQTKDKYINICNNEYDIYRPDDLDFDSQKRYLRKSNEPISKSGFNIHLPSTCRPLTFGQTYTIANEDSEGAIMDVYEDYVDIRGVIFKENNNEYINKYYPLSQYRINIKAK